MKRWTFAALAAATLCAAPALAGTAPVKAQQLERPAATRYADTTERWRGRPALRAALAHPIDEPTASEKVYEHLPSVNFLLEGQNGGAFATPHL